MAEAPRDAGSMAMLMAVVAHELRLPLQALNLNVGMCLDRLRGPQEISREWFDQKLTRQQKAVWRLRHLVDTFLDVTEISAGGLVLHLEPVDLRELVQEVVKRMADDLSWAGCTPVIRSAGPLVGNWDRMQLDLMLTNLLSNAMRYAAGRPVHIEIWGTEREGHIKVRDEGEGIDSQDHQRIFEKFVRLPAALATPGFGLGLWLVKNIVEALHGTIDVSSARGQGATFSIALPR